MNGRGKGMGEVGGDGGEVERTRANWYGSRRARAKTVFATVLSVRLSSLLKINYDGN